MQNERRHWAHPSNYSFHDCFLWHRCSIAHTELHSKLWTASEHMSNYYENPKTHCASTRSAKESAEDHGGRDWRFENEICLPCFIVSKSTGGLKGWKRAISENPPYGGLSRTPFGDLYLYSISPPSPYQGCGNVPHSIPNAFQISSSGIPNRRNSLKIFWFIIRWRSLGITVIRLARPLSSGIFGFRMVEGCFPPRQTRRLSLSPTWSHCSTFLIFPSVWYKSLRCMSFAIGESTYPAGCVILKFPSCMRLTSL